MLGVVTHKRFEKDAKLAARRGLDLDKLWDIVDLLSRQVPLRARHKPHRLTGSWSSYMECHIEPDWLLIYAVSDDTLELMRTGTRADLF